MTVYEAHLCEVGRGFCVNDDGWQAQLGMILKNFNGVG